MTASQLLQLFYGLRAIFYSLLQIRMLRGFEPHNANIHNAYESIESMPLTNTTALWTTDREQYRNMYMNSLIPPYESTQNIFGTFCCCFFFSLKNIGKSKKSIFPISMALNTHTHKKKLPTNEINLTRAGNTMRNVESTRQFFRHFAAVNNPSVIF